MSERGGIYEGPNGESLHGDGKPVGRASNEIGRPLKADELKERTIVITNAEHRPELFVTMWVTDITDSMVWFFAAATNPPIHMGLFRQPDGTLKDDAGRTIRIFEYLGAK